MDIDSYFVSTMEVKETIVYTSLMYDVNDDGNTALAKICLRKHGKTLQYP